MKALYYHIFIIFVASIITFVVSCGRHEDKTYKIGVAQCSSDEWRDKGNQEMQREMLFHDNGVIEIRSAFDSNEKQIEDIRYFLDNDFDLIVVAPNEAEALTPIVNEVYDKGIPVVIFDRRILNDGYTSYIDLDNYTIGESAAEYANSLFDNKEIVNIIEITGLGGSSPAQERHKGFMEGIKKYPNLKLIESVDGEWKGEIALQLADSLLVRHPEINLVYVHADHMAIGISRHFKELGRTDIKVLGTDGTPMQGIQAVKDGWLDATFIYPTDGHKIIRTAFNILEGKPYEKIEHVPALTSVDKSNADILLRQYDLLKDQTEKVLLLNSMNENLESKHKTLTRFLNTVITLAIVLGLILILVLFLFIRNRKLQKELKEQNRVLIEERDRQSKLYQQLDDVLTKEDEFYSQFITIIKTQFADSSLSTDSMAQKLNLGGAQLTRKIKALTHFSPVEILRNYRLEQAKKLLLSTDKSINEITFAVGFSSAAYLTKCFREHFGKTPTELRNHSGSNSTSNSNTGSGS